MIPKIKEGKIIREVSRLWGEVLDYEINKCMFSHSTFEVYALIRDQKKRDMYFEVYNVVDIVYRSVEIVNSKQISSLHKIDFWRSEGYDI